MPTCDYCKAAYRGGAAVRGKLRFCTNQCRDRGRVLEFLNQGSPAFIDQRVDEARAGPCPECGTRANVHFHQSHRIWSAMVYTTWKTQRHSCCQNCGRNRQPNDLTFSRLPGWWMAIGFCITPFQIGRNILGMTRRGDQVSPDLIRTVRVDLARELAART
jgi:hypothetical protein